MRWTFIILLMSLLFLFGCRKASNRKSSQKKEKVEITTTSPSSSKDTTLGVTSGSSVPLRIIDGWSIDEIKKANTAIDCTMLNNVEKDIILYTNLARLDGKKFSDLYVKSRLNAQPNNSYIKSLVEDLSSINDLPMLNPNESLFKAAEFHANDLGKSGTFQHESTDGSTPSQRMKRYGFNYRTCGENIYAGQDDALGVLLVLLIDEGVKDVGHRKNILSAEFDEIGVARRPHKNYDYNVVQDFGHR